MFARTILKHPGEGKRNPCLCFTSMYSTMGRARKILVFASQVCTVPWGGQEKSLSLVYKYVQYHGEVKRNPCLWFTSMYSTLGRSREIPVFGSQVPIVTSSHSLWLYSTLGRARETPVFGSQVCTVPWGGQEKPLSLLHKYP